MLSAAVLLREGGIDPADVDDALAGVDPEEVPVRVAPWLIRALWARGTSAMTMPWVVWVDPAVMAWGPPKRSSLIVHELAHWAQWRRRGPVPFLIEYLGDYARGRLRGMSHRDAYRAIALEQEAEALRERVMHAAG